MNIVEAFVGTLTLAVVFMVISLIYVNRSKEGAVSKIRHIYTKSNTSIGQQLQSLPHPGAKIEQDKSSHHGNMTSNMRSIEGVLNATRTASQDFSVSEQDSSLGVEGQEDRGQRGTCEEQTSVVLLKTHKTGSSTVQNVLYRYGDVRDLIFALPAVDVYMGCPEKFRPTFAMASPTGKYDILANHARFHKENMRKVMAPGAKFITILRYPPKQFESMYSFYRMERRYKCSLETFAASPRTFYEKYTEKNPRHSALNPVLYDLGLDSRAMDDSKKVDRWIEYVDESFDLVLVAEHLEESLILLKDMMCWTFDDITYFTSNARSGMLVKSLLPQTEKSLLGWLSGDMNLYRHFNATLWKKIEQYGVERMAAHVAELTRRNDEMRERCVQGKKKVNEMGGRTVIERYVLRPEAADDMQCKRITYSAVNYLSILKNKMKLKRPGKKGLKPKGVGG